MVAPFAGAWIETHFRAQCSSTHATSPPSRGRGSKQIALWIARHRGGVAPFAGAWIETGAMANLRGKQCRPLRGGVDRNLAKKS